MSNYLTSSEELKDIYGTNAYIIFDCPLWVHGFIKDLLISGDKRCEQINLYPTKGKLWNDTYNLTGTNRYQDNLDILILCDIPEHSVYGFICMLLTLVPFDRVVEHNHDNEVIKKIERLAKPRHGDD